MRRQVVALALVAACSLVPLLSACSSSIPTETTGVIEGNEILTADLGTDVTAKGVVLAAVVLVAGNVEKALNDGTVTAAEIAAAKKAIADGTVDFWRQRAEKDSAK